MARHSLNLTSKTTLLLAAITFAVLLNMIIPLMHHQEKLLQKTILQGLDGQAIATAHGIDLFLEGGLRDSMAISATLPLQALSQGRWGEIESHLKRMQEVFPTFRSGIFILDPQGKFLVDYPSHPELRGQSYAHREYYQRTMAEQKGVVGQPYLSERVKSPVLTFTSPVRDSQGHIVAIVGGSMDLLAPEGLGGYLQQRFGKTGYLYVFDSHRQLLLHPERDRILTSVQFGKNSFMESALHGVEGGGETVNSRGIPMLVSVRHIPRTDWMVAVQLPKQEAYAPISEGRKGFLGASSLAIFVVMVIGAAAIRHVARPLQQLEQFALQVTSDLEKMETTGSQISDPALNRLSDIRSGDEIGRLAASFLKLATRLHSTFDSLHSTNLQLLRAKEAAQAEATRSRFQHSLIRAIHEVSLDGIVVVNDDRLVVSHNKQLQEILQIPLPDLPENLSNEAVAIPDETVLSVFLDKVKDREPFIKRVQELYNDPDAKDHCEIALKDGRTLERYSTGLRSASGEYLGRVWFFRDITARKQADQALQSSEVRFRQFVENSREVIWMVPLDPNELPYVSPAYEVIWGRSCESLYASPNSWMEAVHPDDLSDAIPRFAAELAGKAADSEYRIITPDGQEKWIHDRAFPIRDEDGKVIRVVGIAEEITQRKRYEAELGSANYALEASEARYRKLIDLSPNAIIVGKNHAIVLANHAAVELFGFSLASDLIGGNFADLVSLEARSSTEEIIQRMYECEMQLPLQEGQIRRTDGLLLDVAVAASSFSEIGGGVVQAVLQNITERKHAEAEHARLIQSIEQVGDCIVITDLEASILYVNPAFEKITGYTRAEAIGNNPRMLGSGQHSASFFQEMWATLLRSETWSGAMINKRKDGTLFTEEATISPIKSKDGKVINYVAVKRDVTQEMLLRAQLNQAQKMEAVGRLAGGIAHDFNNLLMVIQSYTEMLQDMLPAHDTLRKNTREILKAAERGASLTGQMLAFSRKQIISPVVLDLNAVIEDTAKMLKRVIGEDIEFQLVLAESLWAIKADPDQISQILMNLCVNSRDAMPRGGMLTIATGNVTVDEGSIGGQVSVKSGDYVRVSVTDTGTGISKELQERIFEPFFTTKEVSKGTGLGLATVYGIVKQSDGYVWVNSEAGQGTCFTIYLPMVREALTPEISATSEARPQGMETILVAEDEEALREALCDYLRSLGYTVLAASSGQEALLLASQRGHIDLLITDVVMPKMSGRELSQMLGSLRSNLKTIYMSGYTDDAVLRQGVLELGAYFLQKPFSLGTVARKVRDTLGSEKAYKGS